MEVAHHHATLCLAGPTCPGDSSARGKERVEGLGTTWLQLAAASAGDTFNELHVPAIGSIFSGVYCALDAGAMAAYKRGKRYRRLCKMLTSKEVSAWLTY
jgi:hypothetical protein